MLLDYDEPYRMVNEDCITHMQQMPEASVDLSIYSPPFPALYAYNDSEADLGNVDTIGPETVLHFGWFFRAMRRIVKPGRVIVVHCMNIPHFKRTTNRGGLIDFRGLLVRVAERAGLIWEYEWTIRKNPQSQAIRTRSRELQFAGLEQDRAKSRGALPDYLLKFRTPGENEVPIQSKGRVSRDEWIAWAESHWEGIRETDTLNVRGTKGPEDVRHICPLQLEVIRRLVLLFSNPDEIVFSPFAGIGSELYVALKNGNRGYGCELKGDYYRKAIQNCDMALTERAEQQVMFGVLSEAINES